jgi:hypothetical protein
LPFSVPAVVATVSSASARSAAAWLAFPWASSARACRNAAIHGNGSPNTSGAEYERRAHASEHLGAQLLALNGRAVCMQHRQRAGVELRRDAKLRERPVPIARDHEQLGQEHAQLAVRRLPSHVVLQLYEAARQISRCELSERGHASPQTLTFSAMFQPKACGVPLPPFSDCVTYSIFTFAKLRAMFSVRRSSPPLPPVE